MASQFEIDSFARSRQRREARKQFVLGQHVKIIASKETAIVLEDPSQHPLSEFIQVQIDGQSRPKFFCVDEIQNETSTAANPADQSNSRKAERQRRTQTAALKRGADSSFSAVVDPADVGNSDIQRRTLPPVKPLINEYEYTEYPEPTQVSFRHINTDRTGWAVAHNQKGMIRVTFETAEGNRQADIPEKFVVWEADNKLLESHPQDANEKLIDLHDRLATLEIERDRLLKEGPLSEPGAWIEVYKVSKRNFWEATWRATKPIFTPARSGGNVEAKVKKRYIGKAGSPAHQQAQVMKVRRKQVDRLTKQIQLIENQLEAED